MFAKSKVSQSMIDAVKQVVETAPIKEPTPTGMRVYGGSYGNSAKAKQDQTKSSVDDLKEPTKKDIEKDSKLYQKGYHGTSKHYLRKDTQDYFAKTGKNEEVEVVEAAKPDFLDMDKDGNKKESMKKAIADKKAMGEELKGNQDRIDANHNNKIDAQDFKILKAKKKVSEDMHFAGKLLEAVRKSDVPAYLRKAKGDTPLTMADVKGPKKDSISAPENLAKARNEEVEQIEERDEGKPGLMFKKIAAKASKEYGSKEAGNRVAGAIRKKVLAKEEIESLDENQLDEMINEVLGKDATAGDYIHDFIHSDNPKFAGKSKAERKKMALGAYYGKQNEEVVEENYKQQDDAPITTDTLAGRLPGGKINSFKSYKLRVKPLDKEGDGSAQEPACDQPEKTSARASVHAEATIAGTSGWEPMKKDAKDKSGAVHTPMSRARDLAKSALKRVQDKTKIK